MTLLAFLNLAERIEEASAYLADLGFQEAAAVRKAAAIPRSAVAKELGLTCDPLKTDCAECFGLPS